MSGDSSPPVADVEDLFKGKNFKSWILTCFIYALQFGAT